MAYDIIGGYTSGVWLIEKGTTVRIVTRPNLPPEGTGWHYFWLGGNVTQATSRVQGALQNMPVDSAGISTPGSQQIQQAFSTGNYNVQVGNAGGGGVSTGGLFGYGAAGVLGIPAITGAIGGDAAAGGAAGAAGSKAAEGSAGKSAAAGGGAGAAAKDAAKAAADAAGLKGLAGIAAILAALFSPHLFYILGGFVLLLFAVLIIIKQPIKSR